VRLQPDGHMGSYGGHMRVIRGSYRGYTGVIRRSCGGHMEVTWRSYGGHMGVGASELQSSAQSRSRQAL